MFSEALDLGRVLAKRLWKICGEDIKCMVVPGASRQLDCGKASEAQLVQDCIAVIAIF